jgi:hypothetical protein
MLRCYALAFSKGRGHTIRWYRSKAAEIWEKLNQGDEKN